MAISGHRRQQPLAIASFALVLTTTIAGIGLAWSVIGIPVLAFALVPASWFGAIERRRIGWPEGTVPPAYYRAATTGVSAGKSWTIIRDPRRWRDLVHALVILPIRIVTFVLRWPARARRSSSCGCGHARKTPRNYTLAELVPPPERGDCARRGRPGLGHRRRPGRRDPLANLTPRERDVLG